MERRPSFLFRCCLLLVLAAALLIPMAAAAEENLLENGSFEKLDGSGMPAGWYTDAYLDQPGYTEYTVTGEAKDGQHAAVVENFGANDARLAQIVSVDPDSIYCLSGYVKAENIPDAGLGANLSVAGVYVFSDSLYGTDGAWRELTLYGLTGPGQNTVTVYARLGGYSGESEGKAYFDDLRLVKVTGGLPAGAVLTQWYKEDSALAADGGDDTQESAQNSSNWPLLVLLSFAFLILLLLLKPLLNREQPSPRLKREEKDHVKAVLAAALFAAFVLRVILAAKIPGMAHDVMDFRIWGDMMVKYGPANIYQNAGMLDYPPALLYVWGLNSLVAGILGDASQGLLLLNIKSAPIVADMVTALLLYRMAEKKLPKKSAAAISVLYAFNPAVLLNGAAWGQVDSILALGLLLVAWWAMERKWEKALPAYVACVLMKPQALMLGPLGLAALLYELFRKEEKLPLKELGRGLLWSVLVGAVVLVPFYIHQKITWIIDLYGSTLSSYAYTTLNTANFYYFPASYNWEPLTNTVRRAVPLALMLVSAAIGVWQTAVAAKRNGNLFQKYGQPVFFAAAFVAFLTMAAINVDFGMFGTMMMALVISWVLVTYLQGGRVENLPLMGGILFAGLYVLGVMMHERYLFPALILLAMAWVQKRDWRIMTLLVGFSVTTFINAGIVLDNSIRLGSQYLHLSSETGALNVLLSVSNLALTALAMYTGLRLCGENAPERRMSLAALPGMKQVQGKPVESRAKAAILKPRDARLNLKRLDYLLLAGITLAYAILTFWNLGSMKAPQTAWISTKAGEQVVLDLGGEQDFHMLYFGGINYSDFTVAVSADGQAWSEEYFARMQEGNCFQWQYLVNTRGTAGSVTYTDAPRDLVGRYVRITANTIGLNLNEVIFRDLDGAALPARVIAHTGNNLASSVKTSIENLTDEQDTLEGEPGWYNSTYFDEIYHARTAYEHAHGIRPYETSHPPLGKVMMSWAVMAFGMVPFGWRFAGALAGVLMLPVMYLLAKQLTRKTGLAAGALLLMTFDLMHFTQTRIATIDSFPVLFIMLSYLFMFRYVLMDFWEKPFWKTLVPLALSGLFMGMGIASKWIGIYAAVGLAVLFFVSCWRHLAESGAAARLLATPKAVKEERRGAVALAAREGPKRVLVTCLYCLAFFIAVPAAIYYLSYIPYFAPNGGVTLQKIIEAQKGMYNYHSTPGLGADHPYQSPWWEWPLILKPMWYFKGSYVPEGMGSTIFAMGNPAVWWAGFAALIAVFVVFVKRHVWRDERDLLLHVRTRELDDAPALLLTGFASQFMPWVLVPRSTFIYHYFASVPFIILCTVLCFKWLRQKYEIIADSILWTLVALAGILFAAFYPYASGMVTSTVWLDAMKWFKGIYY